MVNIDGKISKLKDRREEINKLLRNIEENDKLYDKDFNDKNNEYIRYNRKHYILIPIIILLLILLTAAIYGSVSLSSMNSHDIFFVTNLVSSVIVGIIIIILLVIWTFNYKKRKKLKLILKNIEETHSKNHLLVELQKIDNKIKILEQMK